MEKIMKSNLGVTLIGIVLAGPVILVWHIFQGIVEGFREFLSLQREWWSLVFEDFK